MRVPFFPYPLQHLSLLFVNFKKDGHSNQCEVIFHCSFDLHFSNYQQCREFFCAPVDRLCAFFGEMSNQVVRPFFDWVVLFVCYILSCMTCLYFLENNPLLIISYANILSHSLGCLVVLSMVSFTMQNILNLIRSYLFLFFFPIILGNRTKKTLL